jgi:acetyl-CoA synthetase
MSAQNVVIGDLLREDRVLHPPSSFSEAAFVNDPSIREQAAADPEAYWASWAEELEWMEPWTKVLDWQPPHARWFVDGKLNACVNCVDRHVRGATRNTAAIIWEGEPGERRVLTYWDLYRDVNRFASALKNLGVEKGDRVAIYMPMVPELVVAMLACARIGAVHMVVFGGFSAEALADRINDGQAKVLVTTDGGWRRGQLLPLKHDADYAVRNTPCIEHVVVVQRDNFPLRMKQGRDHLWRDLMADAAHYCEPEAMDAEDMLYILYTSGTTGKPKGIVHTTGGYLTGVHATSRMVFDLKPTDVFWCTADIGWVTGHSYVVYGPLSTGATIVMYEGAPDWPDRDRLWKIIEDYGVTVFYTAPTAIRAFMKWGTEIPDAADLSSLRLLGSVGEPINPEAWMWYHEYIGRGRCPIVDTWWQTETGMIMVTTLPGLDAMKPGSAGLPIPGVSMSVVGEDAAPIDGGGGFLVVNKPWPAMLRGIYGDPERFVEQYWSRFDTNTYFSSDGAKIDQDGYLCLLGRVDDVLNVSGHRIGTMEIESALVDHPSVAEAAVVGVADDIAGQSIAAFVTLKEGWQPSVAHQDTLKQHVVQKIGAIARPKVIMFTPDLPKTRSGKIMRRLLRDISEGKIMGDTSTLADDEVVSVLKAQYEDKE